MPVIGTRWGAAAEYAVVDERFVAKVADGISFEEAASLPLVSLTAVQALSKLKLNHASEEEESSSSKILIHAGAGGVGSIAIQYAKKVLHMYVATTTSSKKKGRALQKLGADLIIDYTNENFEDAVEYYDAVLDPMNWLYEERTFEKKKDKAPVLKHRVGHYLNLLGSDWKMGEDGNENTNGFYTMKNYLYHKFIHFVLPGTTIPRYDLIYVSPDGEQLQ
eukprot:8795877-Ditylum_brightwellii.AAC.1